MILGSAPEVPGPSDLVSCPGPWQLAVEGAARSARAPLAGMPLSDLLDTVLYPSRTGEAKRGLRQRARHAFAIVLLCEGEGSELMPGQWIRSVSKCVGGGVKVYE
jgi:hypothetical protein